MCFHCRLHHPCRFGVNWSEWVWSHLFPRPCCCYFYFHSSHCRAELGCICHRHYRGHGMPACPVGCGQFTGCKQLSQATTLKSPALNPMASIKPFIFYVLVSWLSYCRGRWDTGPTSQKPQRNYSIWIIHHTRGRYLFKGTDMSLLPSYTVKLKVA